MGTVINYPQLAFYKNTDSLFLSSGGQSQGVHKSPSLWWLQVFLVCGSITPIPTSSLHELCFYICLSFLSPTGMLAIGFRTHSDNARQSPKILVTSAMMLFVNKIILLVSEHDYFGEKGSQFSLLYHHCPKRLCFFFPFAVLGMKSSTSHILGKLVPSTLSPSRCSVSTVLLT